MAASTAAVELTPKEVERITATFEIFKAKYKDNMVIYFQTLFELNPSYQDKFPRLADVAVPELDQNDWLKNTQIPMTFNLLRELIAKLNNQKATKETIRKMVNSPKHAKINLTANDYENAFTALVVAMTEALGLEFEDGDQAIWQKFVEYLAVIIEGEMKAVKK